VAEDLLAAARDLAELTGAVALRYYRSTLTVESKADGSPVTRADREAEEAARAWIGTHFPNDGILGEEFGSAPGTSGRRWILDPVDGTKSFVRGVPLWGSLVALAEGERVLAGAAAFPAIGETIAAASGAGCWWNGVRTRVSEVDTLDAATALVIDDRGFETARRRDAWRDLSSRVAVARSWGDCFGYLLVATGRAEIMVDPRVNPWDSACFVPIIAEAGGVLTDLSGTPTGFGRDAIATNAALGREARALFEG